MSIVPLELLERFRRRECVFFCGAGVSAESGLPTAAELRQLLVERIRYPRPDISLPRAAQAFEDLSDRPSLTLLLREQFGDRRAPGRSHELVAGLAARYCTHLITTNFDRLLENALDAAECDYYVTKRDTDISAAGDRLHLIKLHGDALDNETLVITDADNRDYYHKHPVMRNLLGGLFVEKTLIFLGYSLDDPSFDQVYHDITRALGDFQRLSYAVQLRPSDFSDEDWNKFHVIPWRARQVNIITASAADFLTELATGLGHPDLAGQFPATGP